MIKAIETRYKGYRFRSRLEARWAVFFDALGIDWEYEPEGYILDNGERYLPDFYLPSKNIWVEVKPEIDTKGESVYLAGKIRKNCWRHDIAPMRGAEHDFQSPHDWEVVTSSENIFVGVTGPFFMSCDHGCSHGPGTHGQGQDGCGGSHGTRSKWADHVVNQCKLSIVRSDSVFVWIDSLDCYATLIECGYAAALGKKVFCAVDSKLVETLAVSSESKHELWFMETIADSFAFFDSAVDAFNHYYPKSGTLKEYQKIARVATENGGSSIIVGGDPMTKSAWGQQSAINHIYQNEKFYGAAKKARSARFEHGETP